LSTDFSGASTIIDSEPSSPIIERHPLFKDGEHIQEFSPQFRYGRAQGDTCASCSFSVPQEIADQLPAGAPGSLKPDGKTKNGAPVLRSREFICMDNSEATSESNPLEHSSIDESKASSSLRSCTSSHSDCHNHTLTYLTAKSPDDPEHYSLLRASVIRTLSCEQLPRGMSDGPFCFGDSTNGYTIAYKFRLTDPKARGRRRAYAFLALAGNDTNRAFRACPMVWEAFATMAQSIERAAQRHQDEQKRKEQEEEESGRLRNYTPVSSFLTQRTNDPDGHPRRAGQVTPRSLAEIVGDENIFAILHQYFVVVLRCLGGQFGGLPLADKASVYQTIANERGLGENQMQPQLHSDMMQGLVKARDGDDATPTPITRAVVDEIEAAKARINATIQRNTQCAPLASTVNAQRQVVV
jgi:Vesicle coat protein involved in Golgi to plasma membrane transport